MTVPAITALPALAPLEAREFRARAIFELGKFDPHHGDTEVLAPCALVLDETAWRSLATDAEQLAAELLAAENEVLLRPGLLRELGLPKRVRRTLARASAAPRPGAAHPRVIRFDFHPTPDGWRISEANADVPGGFLEAAGLASLMGEHFSDLRSPGHPGCELTAAVAACTPPASSVALIHATAYTDDRQSMLWLARLLTEAGRTPALLAPDQIDWSTPTPTARAEWCASPLAAIVRFFPAEWLANLPRSTPLAPFFTDPRVPHINPATALIAQSKRLPLVFDELAAPVPAWRRLLPETRDPRDAPRDDDGWVLKPALGRVGEGVTIRGVTPATVASRALALARLFPSQWVAQRRFASVPISTPEGPRHVCLGVFVISGRAAGSYGRLSPRPLIDSTAQDVAVLISSNTRSFLSHDLTRARPAAAAV